MNAFTTATNEDATIVDVTHASSHQKMLLYAFIAFAFTACAVAIAMLVSAEVADRLLPYYGWPIIGFFYAGALKYAIPPLLKHNSVPIQFYLKAVSQTLLLLIGYGVFTTVLGWTGDDFGNPYLTVASTQPIWTVVVPLVWFALFRLAKNSASPRTQTG